MSKYIPKVGEKCILQSYGFTEFNKEVRIDYMGKKVGCYTALENEEDYTFSISDVIFRPIPTKADVEREQLMEIISMFIPIRSVEAIQNAGFTIPKKVKRSEILMTVNSYSSYVSAKIDREIADGICNLLGDLVEDD